MDDNNTKFSEQIDELNNEQWKRYLYGVVGAEVSTITRFCDECIQISPSSYDTGFLFDSIECSSKSQVNDVLDVENRRKNKKNRCVYLFNGNFNYLVDIQEKLHTLYHKISRHSRAIIIVYNPYLALLYRFANWIGLRKGPKPNVYLTENSLNAIARLAGYEVVRIRPSVFFPIYIPIVSDLVNKFLPIVPIIRRFSFLWVVVLRPIIPEITRPSLSIIIPARNESGNIENAIQRIPDFPGNKNEIIFIEGNSNDDTWDRIQSVISNSNNRFSIKAFEQTGIGKHDAVRIGFENATGELVTILDADLTMPPEMLPLFYEAYCQGMGDFINGSRLIYPMEKKAMRPLNRMGNFFFSRILSWTLGISISDSLCGTKLFSLSDYKRFVLWGKRFGDFDPFGDFEMLFAASELSLGIIEIPVRYYARKYGETNISRFKHGLDLMRMIYVGFLKILIGKTK